MADLWGAALFPHERRASDLLVPSQLRTWALRLARLRGVRVLRMDVRAVRQPRRPGAASP